MTFDLHPLLCCTVRSSSGPRMDIDGNKSVFSSLVELKLACRAPRFGLSGLRCESMSLTLEGKATYEIHGLRRKCLLGT